MKKTGKKSSMRIGDVLKIQGMSDDFKILAYGFVLNGFVEMILESSTGNRIFLKRRKAQVQPLNAALIDNKTNILIPGNLKESAS
jgi:hypothetical protein